ncbi:MAG: hypothetical protein M3Y87_35110 [Myxococcota bacterium]|nr:hypothetical protein [Myxococcota bacterium]
MENLWVTLGKRRAGVWARGEALVRRTRESGVELLGRVEGRATTIQRTIALRREILNGAPIERLERRVLVRLEDVLDRMGLGLRSQMQRLAAVAPERATERDLGNGVVDGEIVPSAPRAPAARATKKKRIRVPVSAPASSAKPTSNGRAAPTSRAKQKPSDRPTARRVADPASRSTTRWVSSPAVDVEALASLSAKELASRIPALAPDVCRALLAREKQSKKRKTILDALSSRLPS